jgi:uncharacterized protein YsxB (DUF464 family)
MIKVTLQTQNSTFVSLEAKGHADSAPYGQDLVCASISAIILGGSMPYREMRKDYEVKVEAGYAYLKSSNAPNAHDAVVLETIVTQIESVASSYPKNVALERK